MLANIPRLVTAYYAEQPDPSIAAQRVAFGTSGHCGSAFDVAFNENHILAITQAICTYRKQHGIDGPLFLGIDTHALSEPAQGPAGGSAYAFASLESRSHRQRLDSRFSRLQRIG
jgi:phosphoglucomutase